MEITPSHPDLGDDHLSKSKHNDTTKLEEIQNFVKCHKAIQELCLRAATCVKNVLNEWHTRMLKGTSGLKACTSQKKCGKIKGRPKKGSCPNCLDWADEIENVVFPQDDGVINGLCWKNVKSPTFKQSSLEVAKVFVYNAPEQRMAEIDDFTKFDGGSLLMIMKLFSEFLEDVHQRACRKPRQDDSSSTFTLESSETTSSVTSDSAEEKRKQDYADKIDKVLNIRNRLCHIDVGSKLQIPDEDMNEYFTNMRRLVFSMESLGHFSEANCKDIDTKLFQIRQQSSVTSEMIEETKRELQNCTESPETFESVTKPLVVLQQHIGTLVQVQAGKVQQLTVKHVNQEIHYHVNNDKNGNCMLKSDQVRIAPKAVQQGLDAMANLPYNKVKRKVKTSLTIDNLEEITDLLRKDPELGFGISKESIDEIKTTQQLLDCLEYHKLLGPYNLLFLPILLLLIEREDLKAEIDKLAEHMRNTSKLNPLTLCSVGTKLVGGFLTEIKITGDPEYLHGYQIEEFRTRLGSQLLIPLHNVRFEAAGRGCFVIVFILPDKVRSTLRSAAVERAMWLQEAGIIGVHIEDEDYISLLDAGRDDVYDDNPEHYDDDKSETLSHLTSIPEDNTEETIIKVTREVHSANTRKQHKQDQTSPKTDNVTSQMEQVMTFKEDEFRQLSLHLRAEWNIMAINLGFNTLQIERLWSSGIEQGIEQVVFDMLVTWQDTQPQVLNFRKALSKVLEITGRQDLVERFCRHETSMDSSEPPLKQSKRSDETRSEHDTAARDSGTSANTAHEEIQEEEQWREVVPELEDIVERKRRLLLYDARLPAPVPALKQYVRKLQEDMTKIARKMKKAACQYLKPRTESNARFAKSYLFASLNVATEALELYAKFGMNSGLVVKLLLHRAECGLILCTYMSYEESDRDAFDIAKENSKGVLEKDKQNECAIVVKLLAEFLQISDRSLQENALQGLVKHIVSLAEQIQNQSAIRTSIAILKDKLSPDAWIQCSKPFIKPTGSDSGLGDSISRSGDGFTDGDSGYISSKTSKSKLSRKEKQANNKQSNQAWASSRGLRVNRKRDTSTSTSRSETDLESEISSIVASDSSGSEHLNCVYCDEEFHDSEEKEQHSATMRHKSNVSRLEGPYEYREPPPNIADGKYEPCDRQPISTCAFAEACSKAHSEEELKEWQERFKLRKKRMADAVKNKLHSQLDDLLLQYKLATKEDTVLTECPEKVSESITIICPEELQKDIIRSSKGLEDNKPETFNWNFTVETYHETPLRSIGLLYDEHRSNFHLLSTCNTTNTQMFTAKQLLNFKTESDKGKTYNITVSFSSKMLGEFQQWVVFDFGGSPKLVRKLQIRVADILDKNECESLQPDSLLQSQKWDWSEYQLIPFTGDSYWSSDRNTKPAVSEIPTKPITEGKYKDYMKSLLNIEENHRLELLKRFGMETDMKVVKTISITDFKFCTPNRAHMLFGEVDLSKHPLDDSPASQIILNSVEFVKIKFENSDVIYEAAIYKNWNLDEMKTPDKLYVELSQTCVEQLCLVDKEEKSVQIQFVLQRKLFQTMRQAVDEIGCLDFLFPAQNPNPVLISPRASKNVKTDLNKWQECAARFMRNGGGNDDTTPLLLMYGPFGSGKTYTLARTTMQILRDNKPSPRLPRILICTHSNSAADIYITHYFAEFMEKNSSNSTLRMCRVYATSHDKRNIPKKVKPFCNLDHNGQLSIRTDNIAKCQLVITTTSTAARLSVNKFRDHFTHILVDEAAQVLETEAIIPLRLATSKTCVVLAGDHRQMGPKVYSKKAMSVEFHHSLLQRLIEYCITYDCRRYVQMTCNYRTQKEILSFLSTTFYGGRELVVGKEHHRLIEGYPMEFRAVIGQERFTGNSFVNELEAQEVCKRIETLKAVVPKGDNVDIGVLTPYTLQVRRIRQMLRERNLQGVTVERVQNVQGKQYGVIIVSTVRTQESPGTGKQPMSSEDYLGFLSDWRQLNTAFTRAQSLLIVVGNPKTLCSVGKCCIIWNNYLKICRNNDSLYPNDLSLEEIQAKSQNFPTSEEIKESSYTDIRKTTNTLFSRQISNTWTPDTSEDKLNVSKEQNATPAEVDFDDLEETGKNDLILEWLAPQIQQDHLDLETALSAVVIEEDDHITFKSYPKEDQKSAKQSNLKRCIFKVDFDHQLYAVPVSYPKASKKIHISTNTQRKTALDGDVVDVEVLTDAKSEEEYQEYGRVENIVQRSQKMEGKKVICFPDPFSDNLMVPFDQHLPKIIISILKNEKASRNRHKGGPLKIPIYKLQYRDGNPSESNRSAKYQFDRFVEVTNQDRPNKLFIVQWLFWSDSHYYPLGTVVDYIQHADNVQDGLNILKLVYSVPQPLDDDVLCDEPYQDGRIQTEIYKRLDLRHQKVFTIDPMETRDHDDALSIEETSDGFVVWIHISDVSFFISKDSELDNETRRRGTSFYPHQSEPIHMLPTVLSTGLCSLVQGEDRLAISYNKGFDSKGNSKPDDRPMTERFKLTVINCERNLHYKDVQQAIDDQRKDGVYGKILQLYKIASNQREKRLGLRKFAEHCDHQTMSYPQAHILVEEFMIMANHQVAVDLTNSYGKCTPVRRQQPPLRSQFLDWKSRNEETISESIYLSSQESWMYSSTTDSFKYNSSIDHRRSKRVAVLKHVWDEIKVNGRTGNIEELASLLCTDNKHPGHAVVLNNLHLIMPKGEYVCSGDHKDFDQSHTDLRLENYTHFTSPIRRYVDLVVHRQLIAALLNKESPPHSQDEIRAICHECTILSARSREFEFKTRALYLASEVKQCPVQLLSFVESVSQEGIMLGFSAYPSICSAHLRNEVKFTHLKPFKEPTSLQDMKKVSLTWRERIYHVHDTDLSKQDLVENRKRTDKLINSTRFVEQIPVQQWMRILRCVIGDKDRLRKAIAETDRELSQNQIRTGNQRYSGKQKIFIGDGIAQNRVEEVSSISDPFVTFKRPIAVGDVIQVQLQCGLKKGIIAPRITLMNLTPQLELCLAHRVDPVSSFASVVDEKPRRSSINDYQATWLPIIEMENTYSALRSNDTIIVHGVQIEWLYRIGNMQPCGSFSFPESFCKPRHIKFFSPESSRLKHCFLCIRYKSVRESISFEYNQQLKKTSTVPRESSDTTFVAHAYVVDVNRPESSCEETENEPNEQAWTVYFEVHQCLSEFPLMLLTSSTLPNGRLPSASIEIIPKGLPARRIEEAMGKVNEAPAHIQDICLHRTIDVKFSDRDVDENEWPDKLSDMPDEDDDVSSQLKILAESFEFPERVEGSPFPSMNKSQRKVIESALLQPFTVIQGPPGTGKTVTGAYMVYFFTQLNSKLKFTSTERFTRGQVLYCGPSNKAVDVITDYLRKFKRSLDDAHIRNNLSFVRVYSDGIEFHRHPIKDMQAPVCKQLALHEVNRDTERDSLHFKMRQNRDDESIKFILEFEKEFAPTSRSKPPTNEQYEKYKETLMKARAREIRKYNVVLCTCSTAAWKIVRKYTNIVECIIDEAGMCCEPETLVPLVSTTPKRVVLIGDHKQLRPIVQDQTAKQLGLDISLLESYSDQSEMLDTQYRMTEAICEFPSKEFYAGKLKTGRTAGSYRNMLRDWPGGEHQPIAFCHIEGHEKTVSVQTDEGHERSKFNEEEVRQVARIVKTLVKQYNISQEKIAVLTQYRQQYTKLAEALSYSKLHRVAVSTVIKSQGSEWDFVILSTVRTLPWYQIEVYPTRGWKKKNLGFITDENQMNVALTRAREGLVIVGNMNLLKTDSHWENLIKHYEEKNCTLRAREFLYTKRKAEVKPDSS